MPVTMIVRGVCAALLVTLVIGAALSMNRSPQSAKSGESRSTSADPFQWLEPSTGDLALAWVRAQNERTARELLSHPRYESYLRTALSITEDDRRLSLRTTFVLGRWVYETTTSKAHPRGIWQRASIDSVLARQTNWKTLLDFDELARREGLDQLFAGTQKDVCRQSARARCMIFMSEGEPKSEVREFDADRGEFVKDGFRLPPAFTALAWQDDDTLLVATDWGPDTTTKAGMARVLKEVRRGQPLSAAKELFRAGPQSEIAPRVFRDTRQRTVVMIDEIDVERRWTRWLQGEDGMFRRTALPQQLQRFQSVFHQDQFIFSLTEDWTVRGRTWKAGSVLSIGLQDLTSASPEVHLVFQPGPREVVSQVETSSSGVLATIYANVQARLLKLAFDRGAWTSTRLPLPDHGAIPPIAADAESSVALALYESFLQPPTIYAIDVPSATATAVRSQSAHFAVDNYVTEQLEATSSDGTRIPYFVVRAKSFKYDGNAPTLLRGYGASGAIEWASYMGVMGCLWLEQGGVFVLANIRGGGEMGPAWSVRGVQRQLVYDDFTAIAQDLIQRKITSPRRLGIDGASSGGLLVGVMLTQHPELFNAAVAAVPVLDLLRPDLLSYGGGEVGAAIYGSLQNPAERSFMEKTSPYQNLRYTRNFPAPLLVTSTQDTSVYPAHARKFAAKLDSLGMPFYFYETAEGGHQVYVGARQEAEYEALLFTYLAKQLM